MDGTLQIDKLTLPPKIERERKNGHKIRASYHFEVAGRVRYGGTLSGRDTTGRWCDDAFPGFEASDAYAPIVECADRGDRDERHEPVVHDGRRDPERRGEGGVEVAPPAVGVLLHPEVGSEQLGNETAEAAGGGDDAFGVLGQEVQFGKALGTVVLMFGTVLGLGLAIVREKVEMLGGSVEAGPDLAGVGQHGHREGLTVDPRHGNAPAAVDFDD